MSYLKNVRTIFLLVLILAVPGFAQAAAYSQLVAFGDSLSDTGNVFAVTGTPVPPYYDGNYSNGPVWVDRLAQMLGLPQPMASQTPLLPVNMGTNYAWGGARTTITSNGIPSTQTQVATYLGEVGGAADPNALYTILTGGNDINGFNGTSYGFPQLAADGMAVALLANDLALAGAQHILVLNVPDLGLAPIADGNEGFATFLTSSFNEALEGGLTALASPYVSFLDVFTTSQQIAADPGAYGLTNVEDNCLVDTGGAGGAICDSYLFWDSLHPTAAGHELIAQAAFAAVIPIPAAAWLFGSALMGLLVIKRKR